MGRGRKWQREVGRGRWLQTPNSGPSEAPPPCPFLVETPDTDFSGEEGACFMFYQHAV